MTPSASVTPQLPPVKKRKKTKGEEVDDAILKTLTNIEGTQMDEEELFGRHVGAALRRFTPRQRAIAKLQIEQILVNTEFPEDN